MYRTTTDLRKPFEESGNGGTIINYNSLPKINGELVESVWCPCDLTTDEKVLDTTHWKFHTYFRLVDLKSSAKVNSIGVLPKEFKELMGWQQIEGIRKKVFVRHVSFRTGGSHNGSFIDNFMTVYCSDEKTFSAFHSRYPDTKFNEQHPYIKKWLALLGKSFKTTYPAINTNAVWKPYHYTLKDEQGTFFEKLGGLNYPCCESHHWAPTEANPFVSLDNEENIRLWDKETKSHIFISRVHEVEKGDTELVIGNVSTKNPYYFHLRRWNREQNDIVRFNVLQKHRDGRYTVEAMKDGVAQWKCQTYGYFYKITRISRRG